jgi:hypothetical protein
VSFLRFRGFGLHCKILGLKVRDLRLSASLEGWNLDSPRESLTLAGFAVRNNDAESVVSTLAWRLLNKGLMLGLK